MLPFGYDPKDIKDEENVTYLHAYRMAMADALSLFDNMDVYASESLLAHKLSEDNELRNELKTIVQDWSGKMIDQLVITLLELEANSEG